MFLNGLQLKKIKLLSWNCRGLGCVKKCEVVRNVIKQLRYGVCLLQETKWNQSNFIYYSRILPTFYDRNCVVVHAANSVGGILIVWKRGYSLLNSWATRNTCSALLQQISTEIFRVNNIYGPSIDKLKPDFIHELKIVASLIWLP